MPRQRKNLIDEKFHARIGRVVVEFGQLEAVIRASTSGSICPAINEILCDALLARTRFTELIELYTFFISYALREASEDQILRQEEKTAIEAGLAALRREMMNLNERRNNVVHSEYVEEEHYELGADAPYKRGIAAFKPILHPRALDYSEEFSPFKTLDSELDALVTDIAVGYRNFLAFDRQIVGFVNHVWDSFAERVVQEKQGRDRLD